MSPPSLYETLTPEQIAQIKLRYESGLGTIAQIAADVGLQEYQVRNLRLKFGWPSRRDRARQAIARATEFEQAIAVEQAAQESAATARAAQERQGGVVDRGDPAGDAEAVGAELPPHQFDPQPIVAQLREMIEREVARLRNEASGDENLRRIEVLSRSLKNVSGIAPNANTGTTHDEPPIDVAELRRELVRRIHRLRDERAAAGSAGEDEPAGN